MYEENNSQDKSVVIGIDHGFSLMKTKHHIFGNGVVRCNGRSPVAENSFYYDGSYYCIGGERKTVHEDKTADEDFFLLAIWPGTGEASSVFETKWSTFYRV